MAKKKEKKEKKAGKRMSKKQLAALLIDFFHAKQSETLSMKYIFSELHLTTHPQKMLCVDILHEMLDVKRERDSSVSYGLLVSTQQLV